MSNAKHFRKHAQDCRETAALLASKPEKELWLKIAAEYDQMAEETEHNHGPQLAQQPDAAPPNNPEENAD